jgi:hypothetical protein
MWASYCPRPLPFGDAASCQARATESQPHPPRRDSFHRFVERPSPSSAHSECHGRQARSASVPPPSIAPPIEAVRRVHDKHFARWPPHINLIYPFLASPAEDQVPQGDSGDTRGVPRLKQTFRSRLNEAIKHVRPFCVNLSADPPGVFSHGPRGKTVWLAPSPGPIEDLQAALQAEFSECDSDSRPFTPHLSVGQARSHANAQKLGDELRESVSEHLSGGEGNSYQLDWLVDKVYVIERTGYHGRFKVLEAIELRNE